MAVELLGRWDPIILTAGIMIAHVVALKENEWLYDGCDEISHGFACV